MVKNLPAVERSTKIRFGKNVPDSTDQAENTIVFNASNVHINAEYAGSVYMTPLRVRTDVNDRSITVLTYNRTTKEVMDSGAVAEDILQFDLEDATRNGNTTSNTIQFVNPDISFITSGNVGIANGAPIHTVDIGSNLYIDEFGSNVLVVSGNVAILRDLVVDGNLRVNGDTTVIYTENTAIKDALIELGQNNTSADTTLDLGILMHRPDALSNVVIGYREGTDEFAIGYTDANPTDKTFTPKTDEDINVHVYGLTHVDANIYAHEDILVDGNVYVGGNVVAYKDFTLTGNAYVSGNVSVTEELTISNNVYADKDLEVVGNVYVDGNVVAYKDFTLTGNAYVSGNVSVTEELTISNNVYANKDLEVVGNVYVDGNVVAYKDFTLTGNAYVSGNVSVTEELTISGNVYADKDLEVVGNVYVDGNVVAYKDFTLTGNAYVSGNVSVTEELTISNNVYADKDLEVVGNVYVDGNVVAYKDFTLTGNAYVSGNVSITEELTISNNVYADKDVEILGNTYVSGNVTTYKDLLVSGNAYVSGNVSVTEELTVSGNVYTQKDVEILGNTYVSGNVTTYKDLLVSGNAYVSQNIFVTEELTVSGNVYTQKDVEILGNTYVSGNVTTYKDLLVSGNVYVSQNVFVTEELTVSGNVYTQKDLEVMGNTYVSGNVVAYKDLLVSGNVSVAEELTVSGNVYAQKDLEVVGNVYVDGNVVAYKDLSVTGNAYVSGNVNVTKQLSVSGNAYVSGNVEVTKSLIVSANTHLKGPNVFITNTLDFLNPKTAIVTDLNSNVEIKLNQLANVVIGGKALASEDMLVYDGSNWTNQLQNHTFLYGKAEEVIDKGEVVYATGTVGNNMFSIRKARSDSSATMPALGVAYQDLTVNGEGLIVTFGRADGMNTDNFETGETVYVSNVTAGALSNVKPYGATDLIQNIGLVVKGHPSTGIVSVTGVGRSNDIPNAPIETSNASVNYVYVNSENNDLRKIDPMKLPTKFQTLAQVVNTGNTVSNTINVTGLTTTGNVNVTSNISVAGLIDPNNKYLPMVDTNGYFVKSPVYVTNEGKYVISAGEAEFLGNITLGGNTTIISSTSVTIEDRIFGVGANNSATGLDSGFMIEHQDDGTFANVALIHHADEHRFSIGYTQNTFTDNHILYKQHDDGTLLRIELHGNLIVQNNLSVSETGTFDGRVGVKTVSPGYDLDVWGTANVGVLTATTVSAENVKGTVVTGSTLYGTLEGSNTASFSTLYGTIGGSNTASVSDLTASGTIKGAAVTGTTLYGTLSGSNTASVSTLTASGTVKGATLTGTNLYGTLSGSNTASVSTLTASGTVKGATLTGTNLYGTLAGSNTASVSTLTASGTVKGATLTGTNLYGTLAGSNTASVSDLTASGTIKGAAVTGTTLYGTLAGSNTASVSDLTASGTVKGATLTGTNLYGTLSGSNTASVSTLTVGGTTQATSTTTGALTVAGGISTQTNVHAANVYISGGLITNTAGVTRKTYAYSGTIGDTEQPHINVCFTNESFSAKIDAQLIEGDDEISVISLVCCGGNKSGTFPASDIKTGSVQVFGPASTNAWNVAVVTDKTTVALRPFGALDGTGEYHIFVEYLTAKAAGAVANVVQDTSEEIVFGY
jgi:cytoskeletal protein CcmA (bactofilin family)